MSLRSRYHVNAYMVLTRADYLFIHNYIRSFLNIILRPIVMVRTRLEHVSYCLCVCRLCQLSHIGSYYNIYIYIYIYIYLFNRNTFSEYLANVFENKILSCLSVVLMLFIYLTLLYFNPVTLQSLPCYIVPSSRNRHLATSITVPLHITIFLASASIFMMLSLAI